MSDEYNPTIFVVPSATVPKCQDLGVKKHPRFTLDITSIQPLSTTIHCKNIIYSSVNMATHKSNNLPDTNANTSDKHIFYTRFSMVFWTSVGGSLAPVFTVFTSADFHDYHHLLLLKPEYLSQTVQTSISSILPHSVPASSIFHPYFSAWWLTYPSEKWWS